jgi:hypothetical protein
LFVNTQSSDFGMVLVITHPLAKVDRGRGPGKESQEEGRRASSGLWASCLTHIQKVE